ncbi:MAG: hypothetical protein K1X39_15010 [Thermoflexales bacterium]|nr:hypothetical protein [Thermoflexales bacterium]
MSLKAAPTRAAGETEAAATALPSQPAPGLSLSSPATFSTTVALGDLTVTLVGLGLPAGFPAVTPDAGLQLVAPQLMVVCTRPADDECPSLGAFELIDADGTRHSPVIAVTGEGFLPKGEFGGGTAIAGGMVFMPPVDAAPYVLRYAGSQGREAFFVIE